jgi:diguanylate cyclase (GGDEF)-like protein
LNSQARPKMKVLMGFDIRTALACDILMACTFGMVIGVARLAYPRLRGLGLISIGLFAATPGAILIALRGHVPNFASVILGHLLMQIWYVLLYYGTLQFPDGRNRPSNARLLFLTASIALGTAAMIHYTVLDNRIVPRIITVSLVLTLQFGLFSYDILRLAAGRVRLRLFGAFLGAITLFNLSRAILTPILGCDEDLMKVRGVQSFGVLASVLFTMGLGIFYLIHISAELHSDAERLAFHDTLTGTLNRSGIESRLEEELDRSSRNQHVFCLALVDIDYFKSINDTGGHAAGDEALRSISHAMTTALRSYDLLGRYGGDEFLLLLPDTATLEAHTVMTRIGELVSDCRPPDATHLIGPTRSSARFTVSIGFTEFGSGDTASTMLMRADAALYDAKREGRNCIRQRPGEPASAVGIDMHPIYSSRGQTFENG